MLHEMQRRTTYSFQILYPVINLNWLRSSTYYESVSQDLVINTIHNFIVKDKLLLVQPLSHHPSASRMRSPDPFTARSNREMICILPHVRFVCFSCPFMVGASLQREWARSIQQFTFKGVSMVLFSYSLNGGYSFGIRVLVLKKILPRHFERKEVRQFRDWNREVQGSTSVHVTY